MKGKTFLGYRILLMFIAVVACAGAMMSFIPKKENTQTVYAALMPTEDFSQVDTYGNIFSVEKVLFDSLSEDENKFNDYSYTEKFLTNDNTDDSYEYMLTSNPIDPDNPNNGNKYVKFDDSKRTVVKDNDFVMLNNEIDFNGKYYAKDFSTTHQEAILVSFGVYYFTNETKTDYTIRDEDDATSAITWIDITATVNKHAVTLPAGRQFNSKNSEDFVFVIPQVAEYEGDWEFNIRYFFEGNELNQTFKFRLLFKSSYTLVENGYTTEPKINNVEDGNIYNFGSGKQYPTLTYDYTRYQMSYTHTANGVIKNYEYKFDLNSKTLIGKDVDTDEVVEEKYLDYYTNGKGYIVFVFTEGGTYEFSFKFMYKEKLQEDMNLTCANQKLRINGYQVKYSKYGYEEAQLKYLQLTTSDNNSKANIIVPNGHNLAKGEPSTNKMGVVYNLVQDITKKVGTVIESTVKDSNVLTSNETPVYIENNELDITETTTKEWLDGLNYIKTNQGSIWLTSTNNYLSTNAVESFYYYRDSNKIEIDDDNNILGLKEKISNTTEFNKPGYYLVFMAVDVNNDNIFNDKPSDGDFYQVFAFQYTTDTVNISVKTKDSGDVIGAGQYTNKKVQVAWDAPGIFDRDIEANYYYGQTHNQSELLKTTAHPVKIGDVLGSEIVDSATPSWATYLVEVKSEGMASTYRTFTIDTEPIKDVAVYAVELSNDRTYYQFSQSNGNFIQQKSISNSASTLFWTDKDSNAEVTVEYSFTPFVKDNSIEINKLNPGLNDWSWVTTNYELGTTVSGLEIFKTPVKGAGATLSNKNIFSQQGIYSFTLTDAAGNYCTYMFIIDKTESFFYIDAPGTEDDNYYTKTSKMYGDEITYTVGTHKVIELGATSVVENYLSVINANDYFKGDGNNISAIKNILSQHDGKGYLIVKNSRVTSFTNSWQFDNDTAINSISGNNLSKKVSPSKDDGGTSLVRKLYIVGENQVDILSKNDKAEDKNSISYLFVEINTDNSRGMVFTRDDVKFTNAPNIKEDGTADESGVNRLYTGKALNNEAQATSDKHVLFTWLVGVGDFEVDSVTYTYYELDESLTYYNADTYFYKQSGNPVELFADGKYSAGAKTDDGQRAYAVINQSNGQTKEGLYVITRTYASATGLGKDSQVLSYYFVVDRSGIIDGPAGKEIKIELLESETPFNMFNKVNAETKSMMVKGETINYSIYLTTNKVPVTAYIPVGKYFDFNSKNGTIYSSGRLIFTIYFHDTEKQLDKDAIDAYKLFEIDAISSGNADNYVDGKYKIDFTALKDDGTPKFLNPDTIGFDGFFNAWENGNSWMYLPGDYVIVISDQVQGTNGPHAKTIAFRVEPTKPVANIYETTQRDGGVDIDRIGANDTELVVNQEFVKFELPTYDTTSNTAMLDTNYLVITRQIGDSQVEMYINNPYEREYPSKYDLSSNSDMVVKDRNGNYTIYLDTRDDFDRLIVDKIITYTITVRYRIGYSESDLRFESCYEYYDEKGNLKPYFEQTFTVIVDRITPTNNISALISSDTLVEHYNKMMSVENLNENYMYDSSGMLYFTNRYTAYYKDTQLTEELYTLKVNNTTKFDNAELDRVYVRFLPASSLSNLTMLLPVTSSDGYYEANIKADNYYDLLYRDGKTEIGVYEIVEIDRAGNMTQYLVEYGINNSDKFKLNLQIKKPTALDSEEVDINDTNEMYSFVTIEKPKDYETTNGNIENFYVVEIEKTLENEQSIIIKTIYANFTTIDNKIADEIVETISNKANGFGTYTILIKTRYSTKTRTLNYYNINDLKQLTIESLIDDNWDIDLDGATFTEKGTTYYFTSITISYLEEGQLISKTFTSTNGRDYKLGPNTVETFDTNSEDKVVYVITATDAIGRTNYYYQFKAGDSSYVFNSIWFGENKDNQVNFIKSGSEYISFQQANITFDTTAFGKVDVTYEVDGKTKITNVSKVDGKIKIDIDYNIGIVKLYPYFSNEGEGALLKFVVELYQTGKPTPLAPYNITIDTRTTSVKLKNNTSGTYEETKFSANIDFSNIEYPTTILTGSKMLIWDEITSENFNFNYTLLETLKTGTIKPTSLNNKGGSWQVNPALENNGEYCFIIEILDKQGNLLGTKFYSFILQSESNKIYYVKTDSKVIDVSTFFTLEDLETGLITFNSDFQDSELKNKNVPLYISNEDMNIVYTNDSNINKIILENKSIGLTLYKLDAGTYKIYFATLKVDKNEKLVKKLSVNTSELAGVASANSVVVWEEANKPKTLDFEKILGGSFDLIVEKNESEYEILNKNSLVVEIRYDGAYVNSFVVGTRPIVLNGSGTYSIKVYDLAGNTHLFTTIDNASEMKIDLTILKEVEVTINDEAPVNKGFYNGAVNFEIAHRGNYDQSSISWQAYRNGEFYLSSDVANSVYGHEFTEYGSYSINVVAKVGGKELKKTLLFTITNKNEAKKVFDLTSISGYEIIEVLDNYGVEITNTFLTMLESNPNGRQITYDMLLNEEGLDIGSGKQTFTVTYKVNGGLYPERIETFQFTLNNENPFIDCSLKPGEDTTKSFTVSLNPGIVFTQIGEAVLRVNGIEVVRIDENSTSEYIQLKFSEKVNGDGDYYITLESLSGDLITAFKVEIKEPLNASAIIIIVVVSAIVIGVIVTIIVLRTKMRIR